jgi:hypothetical protein
MSKRKMCGWFDDQGNYQSNHYFCAKWKTDCPRNTNSRCEIVPRKAKPKYKRVKAWGWQYPVVAGGGYGADTDKDNGVEYKQFPCTILIEAKWLKGRKA